MSGKHPASDHTNEQIDNAVKKIVDTIFAHTYEVLEKNKELIDKCAEILLNQETLGEAETLELTQGM